MAIEMGNRKTDPLITETSPQLPKPAMRPPMLRPETAGFEARKRKGSRTKRPCRALRQQGHLVSTCAFRKCVCGRPKCHVRLLFVLFVLFAARRKWRRDKCVGCTRRENAYVNARNAAPPTSKAPYGCVGQRSKRCLRRNAQIPYTFWDDAINSKKKLYELFVIGWHVGNCHVIAVRLAHLALVGVSVRQPVADSSSYRILVPCPLLTAELF